MGTQKDIHKKLIEASKKGDNQARRQLYELYARAMFNICYRMMNNREDAEDIAQEVFLEVYQSIGRFREEAKLSTWIYQIAVTKWLDFLNK